MRLVDAHVHVWNRPPDLGYQNMRRNFRSLGYGEIAFDSDDGERRIRWLPPTLADNTFPAEMLLSYMDWHGIEKAVLVQSPGYSDYNDYVVACARRWPKHFFPCAMVDPHQGLEAVETLERYVDLGMRGLNLHTPDEMGAYSLQDPIVVKLWELASRHHLYVTVHLNTHRHFKPLSPTLMRQHGYIREILAGPGRFRGQMAELGEIATSLPELKICIDHLGQPVIDEDPPYTDFQNLLALAENPNIYITVSALAFFSHEEYPYADTHQFIRLAYEAFGAKRMMFGSDAPTVLRLCTYEQTLNLVRRQCEFLSEADKAWILGETALSILDFPSTTPEGRETT